MSATEEKPVAATTEAQPEEEKKHDVNYDDEENKNAVNTLI